MNPCLACVSVCYSCNTERKRESGKEGEGKDGGRGTERQIGRQRQRHTENSVIPGPRLLQQGTHSFKYCTFTLQAFFFKSFFLSPFRQSIKKSLCRKNINNVVGLTSSDLSNHRQILKDGSLSI